MKHPIPVDAEGAQTHFFLNGDPPNSLTHDIHYKEIHLTSQGLDSVLGEFLAKADHRGTLGDCSKVVSEST